MNSRDPIEEAAIMYRCPICREIFEFEDNCRFHIAVSHKKPPEKDTSIIGSYLYVEEYYNGYIMRVEDVMDDGTACGPKVELNWKTCSYSTKVAQATFRDVPKPTIIDESSAKQIYEGWCDRYMNRMRDILETTWGYVQRDMGGDE